MTKTLRMRDIENLENTSITAIAAIGLGGEVVVQVKPLPTIDTCPQTICCNTACPTYPYACPGCRITL